MCFNATLLYRLSLRSKNTIVVYPLQTQKPLLGEAFLHLLETVLETANFLLTGMGIGRCQNTSQAQFCI